MRLETKDQLDEITIAKVQELIEINIDSHNGFKQAAGQMDVKPLADVFHEFAQQRVRQAIELQKLILRNDEEPITEGSIAGRIHRTIMDWRDALGGGPLAVLKEVERGEDYIKAKYAAALTQTAGSAVTDVLNRHYAAIKKAHERVRELRDKVADWSSV